MGEYSTPSIWLNHIGKKRIRSVSKNKGTIGNRSVVTLKGEGTRVGRYNISQGTFVILPGATKVTSVPNASIVHGSRVPSSKIQKLKVAHCDPLAAESIDTVLIVPIFLAVLSGAHNTDLNPINNTNNARDRTFVTSERIESLV